MAVAVVDLFEVVYVRHEDTKVLAQRYRRLQVMFELLVETFLRQETGQVIPVDQTIQNSVEMRLYGILPRKLQHGIAHHDAVSVAQGTLLGAPEGFAVDQGTRPRAQIPDYVRARTR